MQGSRHPARLRADDTALCMAGGATGAGQTRNSVSKRCREWSSSSPPGSAVSEFSGMPHRSPKRLAREARTASSTPQAALFDGDEPPEVSPEDEEELLGALHYQACDAPPQTESARSIPPRPPGYEAAAKDPTDVKFWFPQEHQAPVGIPPRLYPWQAQCLAVVGVAEGTKSIVYSAPTSGGKTLVAEILMLKTILGKGKVLFVQPFVALVKEKEASMKKLLLPFGKRALGFHGKHRPHLRFDAAICTFEKALLLSSLLQKEGRLHELKLVVVDELHMVGDDYRGYLLEILLTKLRYMSCHSAQQAVPSAVQSGPQVVAMSATVPNLHELANWLNAEVFKTDFRPVSLREFVVVHSKESGSAAGRHTGIGRAHLSQHTTARIFHATTQQQVRKLHLESYDFDATKFSGKANGNFQPYFADLAAISSLCREVSCCLVFCAVKKHCEEAAEWIVAAARNRAAAAARQPVVDVEDDSSEPHQWTDLDGTALTDEMVDRRRDLLEHLSHLPQALHRLHRQTIPVGVAFHHSGTFKV